MSSRGATGGVTSRPSKHPVSGSVYAGKSTAAGKASGLGGKHGVLQAIGKATAVVRRMPPPATLPSLKAEHGQDPFVQIVPQGTQTWSVPSTQSQLAPTAAPPTDGSSRSTSVLGAAAPPTYTVLGGKKNGSAPAGNQPDLRPNWARPTQQSAPSAGLQQALQQQPPIGGSGGGPHHIPSLINLPIVPLPPQQPPPGQQQPDATSNRDFPSLQSAAATGKERGTTGGSDVVWKAQRESSPRTGAAGGGSRGGDDEGGHTVPMVSQPTSAGYIGASSGSKGNVERRLPERFYGGPTESSKGSAGGGPTGSSSTTKIDFLQRMQRMSLESQRSTSTDQTPPPAQKPVMDSSLLSSSYGLSGDSGVEHHRGIAQHSPSFQHPPPPIQSRGQAPPGHHHGYSTYQPPHVHSDGDLKRVGSNANGGGQQQSQPYPLGGGGGSGAQATGYPQQQDRRHLEQQHQGEGAYAQQRQQGRGGFADSMGASHFQQPTPQQPQSQQQYYYRGGQPAPPPGIRPPSQDPQSAKSLVVDNYKTHTHRPINDEAHYLDLRCRSPSPAARGSLTTAHYQNWGQPPSDHGDATKSSAGDTGWDAPIPTDHIASRQYTATPRRDEASGGAGGGWPQSQHGPQDVRAQQPGQQPSQQGQHGQQGPQGAPYPPSLLSLRTNYEPADPTRAPPAQHHPAVGYWERSASPYENHAGNHLHQPHVPALGASRPLPEQPPPQFRMLRRNDEKSAEYFAAQHAGAAPPLHQPHHHYQRQALEESDEQSRGSSDHGQHRAQHQPHRAQAKSPSPGVDNIWEKRIEQRQQSVESSEGVVGQHAHQQQPPPPRPRGHHSSPPPALGRHRPPNYPSLTESLDAPMLPLSEQLSTRSDTARRSYRGGAHVEHLHHQDVRFEQRAPTSARGGDYSAKQQKLWNNPPLPNGGDEDWDQDAVADREGVSTRGERKGLRGHSKQRTQDDDEGPTAAKSSKRGSGVENAASSESDRHGGKTQRRGARGQEDQGDRSQHDKFSNMGEFHAEDYGIDASRHKQAAGGKGGGYQPEHYADRRALGNRRGEDSRAGQRQGAQQRRSSVEGYHRTADKTTTVSTAHQPQQRKPKSYEAGDEGAPRRAQEGGGRPITGKPVSTLGARQQSAYVARCLKGASAEPSKTTMGADSSKYSAKRVPHVKSPVISDGAGDEWETASETSQQQQASPHEAAKEKSGGTGEKSQTQRHRNDAGQARGVGKEPSRVKAPSKPAKATGGSSSYLAMCLAEREERERRERGTAPATAVGKGKGPRACGATARSLLDSRTTEAGNGSERDPPDETVHIGHDPTTIVKSDQSTTQSKNAMPARPSTYHVNADYERRKRSRNEKSGNKSRQRRSSTEPPPAIISTSTSTKDSSERGLQQQQQQQEAVVVRAGGNKGHAVEQFAIHRRSDQTRNSSSQRAGSRRNTHVGAKSTGRRDGLAGSRNHNHNTNNHHNHNTTSSLNSEKSCESSNNSADSGKQHPRGGGTRHAPLSESFSVEGGDFEEVLSKRAKRVRQQQIEEERRRELREKERLEKLRAKRAHAIPLNKCQPQLTLHHHPTASEPPERGAAVVEEGTKQAERQGEGRAQVVLAAVREHRAPPCRSPNSPPSPPTSPLAGSGNAWAGPPRADRRRSSSEDPPYVPPATAIIPSPIARPTPKLAEPPRPMGERGVGKKKSDESEEHAQLQKKLDQVKDVWSRPIATEAIAAPVTERATPSVISATAATVQPNMARVQPVRVQPQVGSSPPVLVSSAAFMAPQRQGSATPTTLTTYSASSTPLHLTNNLGCGFVNTIQHSQTHNHFFGAALNFTPVNNHHQPVGTPLTLPPPPIGHTIIKSPTTMMTTTIDQHGTKQQQSMGGVPCFRNGVRGTEDHYIPYPPPPCITPSWLGGNGGATAMSFPELMMSNAVCGNRLNPSPMAHVGVFSAALAPPLHLPPPSMMSCPPPAPSGSALEAQFWQTARQPTPVAGLGPIGAQLNYRTAPPPPSTFQYSSHHHQQPTMRVSAHENCGLGASPGGSPQMRHHSAARVEAVGRVDTARTVEEAAN